MRFFVVDLLVICLTSSSSPSLLIHTLNFMTTICLCWNYKNWIKLDQLHSFSLSFPFTQYSTSSFSLPPTSSSTTIHHITLSSLFFLKQWERIHSFFIFIPMQRDHAQQLSRFNIATKMNSKKEKKYQKKFSSLSLSWFACSYFVRSHTEQPQHSSI